jgi:hypothetical protein
MAHQLILVKSFVRHCTSVLDQVAAGAEDPAVRIVATVAMNKTTWQAVFSKAAQIGDSKSLGDALAAVSLFTGQSGINNGVTETYEFTNNRVVHILQGQSGINNVVTETCLTLIRRGDESRIPELCDLLDRYGGVSLCEDYLNCGQPDLERAGSRWATSRGYKISIGNGSNRARWGVGR